MCTEIFLISEAKADMISGRLWEYAHVLLSRVCLIDTLKKKLPLCEKPTVKDKEILVRLLQNKKLLLSITRLAGTSMMNMPKTPPPSV